MKRNSLSIKARVTARTLFLMSGVVLILLALFAAKSPSAPSAASGWAIVPSPNTSTTQTNNLTAVTCASPSDCWVVGYYITGSNVQQTLIERWDGNSWAIVPSPNTDTTHNNTLTAVACASAAKCWAVGSSNNGSFTQTLIEKWNGTSWTIVPSPNNGTQSNALNGVTCSSASDCWAVGSYTYNTGDLLMPSALGTLIERWNGTSWTIVPSPNHSNSNCGLLPCAPLSNRLAAVTCASVSDCWAVGNVNNFNAFIEHWDGNSWSLTASPTDGAEDTYILSAVTCASASECWGVGYYNTSSDQEEAQTLTERWNGTSWAIVPSPNALGYALSGVTCASASECWAVGSHIERWDGNSWKVFNSPSSTTNGVHPLNGVTCSSASECWAVGYYTDIGAARTLIEQYTASVSPAQLQNISTRLRVQTGDNALIGGFIITGTEPKKVIVRALGPSISSSNMPVPGRLADPLLELHAGSTVATNDNWKVKSDGSSQQAEIEATGIPPTNDLESALVRTLSPGPYTAVIRGNGDGTGIGLMEVYDLSQTSASLLANISSRGFVDINDNVMIGGFIAGPVDRGNARVVVRALGPSLSNSGVPNTLQNPTLELFDAHGSTIASNDDWQNGPGSSGVAGAGLAPRDTRESAIFIAIIPGQYTAIVRGVGGTTGVGLVEVYNLQ
jgi:hypothetical protein